MDDRIRRIRRQAPRVRKVRTWRRNDRPGRAWAIAPRENVARVERVAP